MKKASTDVCVIISFNEEYLYKLSSPSNFEKPHVCLYTCMLNLEIRAHTADKQGDMLSDNEVFLSVE